MEFGTIESMEGGFGGVVTVRLDGDREILVRCHRRAFAEPKASQESEFKGAKTPEGRVAASTNILWLTHRRMTVREAARVTEGLRVCLIKAPARSGVTPVAAKWTFEEYWLNAQEALDLEN